MNNICVFPNCGREIRWTDLCAAHSAQKYRGEELSPLKLPKKGCDFPECEKPHSGRGYCQGHLVQLKKGKQLTKLQVRLNIGFKKQDGYICLFLPEHPEATQSGHILEHRYVMSNFLGRPLRKFENVHHKNGVRDDNRIENLELWVKPQPSGQRVNDLLDWIKENYPDEMKEKLYNEA